MNWIWSLVIVFLVVFFTVILSYIRIEVYFSREKNNDQLSIQFKALFNLLRYKLVIPVIQFKDFSEGIWFKSESVNQTSAHVVRETKQNINKHWIMNFYSKARLLIENTVSLYDWLRHTLSHVQCVKLNWNTHVGAGDAPETAIATGMVWGIKSSALGFIMHYVQLKTKPHVAVVPEYNKTQFYTVLSVAVRIRVIHVLRGSFRLLWLIIKAKGGLRTWYQVWMKPKRNWVT
ncbi:hypothetical protein D3C73_540640 [compost metagenome]